MAHSLNEFIEVPFDDAIQDFLSRHPYLTKDPEELRQKYAEEKVFGAVFATSRAMLDRIQSIIAKGFSEGKDTSTIEQEITAAGKDFAAWYSEVVFRTNMSTAYTEGQIEEARRNRDFVLGFEFTTAGDANVRSTHAALEGMRAPVDDPIWQVWKTPLEYNCRCSLLHVTRPQAQRNWLDQSGRLRRWHPSLGYDFTDVQLQGYVSSFGDMPLFVETRL